MRSTLALLTFLFLVLFATTIEARKDLRDYSKIKDEEMSGKTQELPQLRSEIEIKSNSKTQEQLAKGLDHNCGEKVSTKEFEPKPSISAKTNQNFINDFDPTPNIFPYFGYAHGDVATKEKTNVFNDFDPTPNILPYPHGDVATKEKTNVLKDFDTTPNILIYTNDHGDVATKEKTNVFKDFDPTPNILLYPHGNVATKEKDIK